MKVIRIHPNDNVVVAIEAIEAGEVFELIGETGDVAKSKRITALSDIPAGHKIAVKPIDLTLWECT